ncbi:MAG: hypothetical protein C4617_05450 [Candidatus Liberibacter europaeus]|uniref:DUF4145 domain-containing protein n=1 Tax=Candidatus Liberibacter europaeus TaxID=744859 RepID=A0A2T4VWE2_9HYPH|nr:MAG: hypothetical protein C4617_05450 [Candidatus Liberibacter europaeus]
MCRTSLEIDCHQKDIKDDEWNTVFSADNDKGITYLQKNTWIIKVIADLAHHLRITGNSVVHEVEDTIGEGSP